MHLEEHPSSRQESLLNPFPRLGTSLKEAMKALLSCKLFSLGRADFPLIFLVLLIANKKDECIGFGLALDLLKPVL